jgi:hypothetical protein
MVASSVFFILWKISKKYNTFWEAAILLQVLTFALGFGRAARASRCGPAANVEPFL